ncbi:hypothetical protein ESCO_000119 [Escovopsis weberi]|uniref:3',5'-cyclic-nucleotide phosphodiesterase n=1 Tax=Escovopsis weberi TaxID=150374 RepID=A0A0M8MSI1_ESCWE|nr:hypothetical protein ESCO_000119 [Escovopsis weberi]
METQQRPALQVIVLGSGGGPQESNTTAFLVRSVPQNWRKGSIVAVDGGVHLSAITRLIAEALPDSPPPTPTSPSVPGPRVLTTGPFAGLELPFSSAEANAAYVTRILVDTYLITHPHLDHISAFVINTAGLPGTRPKKLAGLPNTIEALKTHIFNNVIWPNLSDENNGAGLLTYLRLVEGGSPALGDGYLEVCDGLLVKTWSVSHGHCMEKHTHRGSFCNAPSTRLGSQDVSNLMARRETYAHLHAAHDFHGHGHSHSPMDRHFPLNHLYASGLSRRTSSMMPSSAMSPQFPGADFLEPRPCVYDSSAYFIQEQTTSREVLIFGDVEPDTISLSPRNLHIWQEAAPKIASGLLAAIFIECSYDDSQPSERLFGHLKPSFIVEELQALAAEVETARKIRSLESKKRKRGPDEVLEVQVIRKRAPALQTAATEEPISPKSAHPPQLYTASSSGLGQVPSRPGGAETPHLVTPTADVPPLGDGERPMPAPPTLNIPQERRPLEGLKIVIIHVKETLTDGPEPGETILQQLNEHEEDAQLGCEFIISKPGQSFYF